MLSQKASNELYTEIVKNIPKHWKMKLYLRLIFYEMNSINSNNIRLTHFSRWTRNMWAAFASLRKTIKISFLSISLTAFALPIKAEVLQQITLAEDSTTITLDEVEVTGGLTPELYSELGRNITVILPQQIQQSPVNSLYDVLNQISALDIRKRSPMDVQADVSIRASNFDQVLILINGINVNNPQTGHHNLDLPINLNQIERIEILKGPASRFYGDNAFAGAINIITKKPNQQALELGVEMGDFGSQHYKAALNWKHKRSMHLLSLGRSSSKGYIQNTDFKKNSLMYSGSLPWEKNELQWQVMGSTKSFGAQNFYTPKYPNQFEATKNLITSIAYHHKGKITTEINTYFKAQTDRFELFRNYKDAASWYTHHNYHNTLVGGMNARFSSSTILGKTSWGANFRNEKIFSNVLGNPLQDTLQALWDQEGYYTKSAQRYTASLFGEQIIYWKGFRIAAGLLVNHFAGDSIALRFFPGVDISRNLSNQFKILANFNTGLRRPTFTDLYYQGPSNIGNPDLLAEKSTHFEIGFQYKPRFMRFNANAYYILGENTIDWARKSDTLKWQPLNIRSTTTKGFDINGVFFVNQFWSSQSIIQTLKFSYAFNAIQGGNGDYQSHYVSDYLKHNANLEINLKLFKACFLSASYRYFERKGDFLLYDFENKTEVSTAYGSHHLMDLKVNYKQPHWEVYALISNVFNTQYYDYGNIIAAGRWFSLGANYRFDFK